jgi:hypothetical protein
LSVLGRASREPWGGPLCRRVFQVRKYTAGRWGDDRAMPIAKGIGSEPQNLHGFDSSTTDSSSDRVGAARERGLPRTTRARSRRRQPRREAAGACRISGGDGRAGIGGVRRLSRQARRGGAERSPPCEVERSLRQSPKTRDRRQSLAIRSPRQRRSRRQCARPKLDGAPVLGVLSSAGNGQFLASRHNRRFAADCLLSINRLIRIATGHWAGNCAQSVVAGASGY